MSKVFVAFVALLLAGGSSAIGDEAFGEDPPVASFTVDLAWTGMGGAFVRDCLQCHTCNPPQHAYTDPEGVSTHTRLVPIYECEPWFTCSGCNPEEEEVPDQVDEILAFRLENGGALSAQELFFLTAYLDVRVSDGVAAIRRQCGTMIGFLAVA